MERQEIKDIVYKRVEGEEIKLDLYLPENRNETTPLLLFFHGGTWRTSDKSVIERTLYRKKILEYLLENNYALASIDYRLVNDKLHLPSLIEDCKDAVVWCRKNMPEHGLTSDRLGVWGGSAGAHLAMMTAMMPCERDALKVDFIINHFGPMDLQKMLWADAPQWVLNVARIVVPTKYRKRKRLIYELFGIVDSDSRDKLVEMCQRYSPINYVSEMTPPTLIAHGTRDKIVPISQSRMLMDRLSDYKVSSLFSTYRLGHGFRGITEMDLNRLIEEMTCFVDRVYQS